MQPALSVSALQWNLFCRHDGGGYMISDLVPGDEGDLSPIVKTTYD
jgi:hypothetical protein